MKGIILIFSLLLASLSFGQLRTKYSESEVLEIERNLTKKLHHNLKNYFGDIKFSVYLKVKTKKDVEESAKSNESALFLIGPELNDTDVKKFSIIGVEAKTTVYEGLKDTFNKDVESITRDSLYPYKILKVETAYIESTRYIAKQLEAGNDTATGFLQTLLNKNSSEIINLMGMIIISIVALFGVVILARLIKGPLHHLVESLRTMAHSNNKKDEGPESNNHEGDLALSEGEASQLSNQFRANLEIFKEIITTHPEEIKKIVVNSDEGASGIRKVLPYIYDRKYLDALKKIMSKDEVERLGSVEFRFKNSQKFFQWFNAVIEDLSIKSIGESWTVVEKLPADILKPLLKVKNNTLKEYAAANNSVIAYQIILDILKGNEKTDFIQSLSVDEWKSIIATKDLDVVEVQKVAEEIIVYAKENQQGEGIVTANKIKDSVILPSLLNIIPHKDIKVQDDFVDSLSAVSPHVIDDLKELYWTPRNLLQVPSSHLNEVLRDYDVEDKASIIATLPVDISDFVKSVIPEGKVKGIVEERVENFDESKDKDSANRVTRSFIDSLFNDYKANKFQLDADILQFKNPTGDNGLDDEDFDEELFDESMDEDFDEVA